MNDDEKQIWKGKIKIEEKTMNPKTITKGQIKVTNRKLQSAVVGIAIATI